MSTKKQIKAVKASTVENFVTQVNLLLENGWEFHGQSQYQIFSGKEQFVQFFVKEVDPYFFENDEVGISYNDAGEYPG